MLLLRIAILSVALFVLANASETEAQLKKKIVGIPVYTVNVGDKFIYSVVETRPGRKKSITKRSTITEVVVDVNGNYEGKGGARKLLRDTVMNNSVYYLTTPGVSFAMNEPQTLSPLRNGGLWKTYPLVIAKGKSISLPPSETVVDLGSSKATTKTFCTMSLMGREKLKIGTTVYHCIKISETITEEIYSETIPKTKNASVKSTRTKSRKSVRTATLWYSPELQTLVRYTTKQGNHSFTQHLTKYVAAPKRTAMLETR